MSEKIDKSKWKTKNPMLFEYDSINNIIDIFVRQDPRCPFPFHEEDWWHQGFYLYEIVNRINFLFNFHKLPYKIIKKGSEQTEKPYRLMDEVL